MEHRESSRNHPLLLRNDPKPIIIFKTQLKPAKTYSRGYYKPRVTRSARFSPIIQTCFHFNERRQCKQLNDVNFKDAIGI